MRYLRTTQAATKPPLRYLRTLPGHRFRRILVQGRESEEKGGRAHNGRPATYYPHDMLKHLPDPPDHRDADLVLKLYDLRREEVLRKSREVINTQFWPKSADDILAIVGKREHPLNAPFRQTGGYWELVYGMAKHGIIPADFLLETNGEGLFLFARVQPFLAELRSATNPRSFLNSEWIATETETGRQMMEVFRARVQKAMEKR